MVTLSEKSLWVRSHNALCTMTNHFLGQTEDFNHLTAYSSTYSATDICKFVRRFTLWGPMTGVLYTLYYAFLVGIFYATFKVMGFSLGITSILITLFLLAVVIGVIVGVVFLVKRFRKEDDGEPKEPGIVKTWYSSVKEKTCAFVRVTE